MVINLPTHVKYNSPFLSQTNNLTPVVRIGTKQNAAKEAKIVNHVKSPDCGWLNVDRYDIYIYHQLHSDTSS